MGMRHRNHSNTGSVQKSVSSALITYFFGEDGTKKLMANEFLEFQKNLQTEILRIEVNQWFEIENKHISYIATLLSKTSLTF